MLDVAFFPKLTFIQMTDESLLDRSRRGPRGTAGRCGLGFGFLKCFSVTVQLSRYYVHLKQHAVRVL